MNYLSRDAAPFDGDVWQQIDAAVVQAAKKVLTARRFLPTVGPLGIGTETIAIDHIDELEEIATDGLVTTKGRTYVEIPLLFQDFTLLAKSMESAAKSGLPLDLAAAAAAAEACAVKEDQFIFFGNSELGYEGLLTAGGINKLTRSDWSSGEAAFTDIAAAIEILTEKNIYGSYTLVLSPDLYLQLQRLQPGTGLLEIDRIEKLLDGQVFKTPILGKKTAVLLCPSERNIDLVIGQDMAAAYLEQKDLNHSFRILETILPRVKRKQSIVVFE